MTQDFMTTAHKGKPAIYDNKARVMYTGFKSFLEARLRCEELNKGLKEGTLTSTVKLKRVRNRGGRNG